MVDQYIFSGSLPENASTYVTRDADGELYDGLQAGKFCYVLNSRQVVNPACECEQCAV